MQIKHILEDSDYGLDHHISYTDTEGDSISILFNKDDPVLTLSICGVDKDEPYTVSFNLDEFKRYMDFLMKEMVRK